jgi:Domain of unknown function (DUF4331)
MKRALRIAFLMKLVMLPGLLSAHPMGNFSINHHSTIHVSSRVISVRTVLDFAEIATFQMFPDPRKAADHANDFVGRLHLRAGGKSLPLKLENARSEIVPASAGLPTLRVYLQMTAPWDSRDAVLSFTDENYANRIGWKEVVFEADHPLKFPDGNPYERDRSHTLTAFPEDLLSSAPNVVSAEVRVAGAGRKDSMSPMFKKIVLTAVVALLLGAPFIFQFTSVSASSHREAPLIAQDPLADNTDLYAFLSPDRPDTVTIIANYIPMETPASGPGFWSFDPNVAYNIYVDNDGDGIPNISFEFRFKNTVANENTFLAHLGNAGTGSDGTAGGDAVIRSLNDPDYNTKQTYTVTMRESGRPTPFGAVGRKAVVLGTDLVAPPFNIGPGATPNYERDLASKAVYDLPGGIKVFAGERDDPFFIDLGAIFDRLELRPLGVFGDPRGRDTVAGFSNHSICLQVPIEMLTSTKRLPDNPTDPAAVIGIYANAMRPAIKVLRPDGASADTSGPLVQVSRLGNPLVNELFSPFKIRDKWNSTSPADDIQYRQYEVVAPEIPVLVDLLYGTNTPGSGVVARALKPFPTTNRVDLELVLYKGIPVNPITGPNFTTVIGGDLNHAVYADLLRLNTAIPPNIMGSLPDMNNPGVRRLGLLGGDAAGYPNGRRLFDDVTDIFLRAGAAGTPFTAILFPDFSGAKDPNVPPNNALSDGVDKNPEGFLSTFPYLQTPYSGFDSPHNSVQ